MLKRLFCRTCGPWNLGTPVVGPAIVLAQPEQDHCCPKCGEPSQLRQQSRGWTARKVPFTDTDLPDYSSSNHLLGLKMKAPVGNRRAKGRPSGTRKKPEHWGSRPEQVIFDPDGDDIPDKTPARKLPAA